MTFGDNSLGVIAGRLTPDEAEFAELVRLSKVFSGHRIFRDVDEHRGVRYAAHAVGSAARPHTIITDDLAELRAELEEASQRELDLA